MCQDGHALDFPNRNAFSVWSIEIKEGQRQPQHIFAVLILASKSLYRTITTKYPIETKANKNYYRSSTESNKTKKKRIDNDHISEQSRRKNIEFHKSIWLLLISWATDLPPANERTQLSILFVRALI